MGLAATSVFISPHSIGSVFTDPIFTDPGSTDPGFTALYRTELP